MIGIVIFMAVLAIGVQAGERVVLAPKQKSFYRDFETHHKHPIVG
jgi:hypothetical protein